MRFKSILPIAAILICCFGGQAFAAPDDGCGPWQHAVVQNTWVRGQLVARVACVPTYRASAYDGPRYYGSGYYGPRYYVPRYYGPRYHYRYYYRTRYYHGHPYRDRVRVVVRF